MKKHLILLLLASLFTIGAVAQKAKGNDKKVAALKKEVQLKIDQKAKMAQVMVDKVFSFAELGFHEVETSKYYFLEIAYCYNALSI